MSNKKKLFLIIGIIIVILITIFFLLYLFLTPSLILNGEKLINIEYGNTYEELGAKSKLLGKDYTNNIKVSGSVDTTKLGSYKITYKIKIKYLKKEKKKVRIVNVIDTVPPEIKLLGNTDISLYVGENYKEYGYEAIDNYDGNITDKVLIESGLDKDNAGDYEVIYIVKDSSDNETRISRKVTFKERPNLLSSNNNHGVPILMYHFFYDENEGNGIDANYMSVQAFEEQIKYLDENDYYFPKWSELRDYVDGKIDLPEKSVIVSIDDGHPTFFDLAVPIINKYNVKATSFIITTREGGRRYKENLSPNIYYESHTHDMHKGGCDGGHGGLFRCIDVDKGIQDLKTSCEILNSCDAIAYPFGDVTDRTIEIMNQTSFKIAVTTEYGKAKRGMDPYKLPRVRMSRGMSLESFIASL